MCLPSGLGILRARRNEKALLFGGFLAFVPEKTRRQKSGKYSRAELRGTNSMGQTGFCENPRFPAVFGGFPPRSAPPKCCNIPKKAKICKIRQQSVNDCEFGSVCPFEFVPSISPTLSIIYIYICIKTANNLPSFGFSRTQLVTRLAIKAFSSKRGLFFTVKGPRALPKFHTETTPPPLRPPPPPVGRPLTGIFGKSPVWEGPSGGGGSVWNLGSARGPLKGPEKRAPFR